MSASTYLSRRLPSTCKSYMNLYVLLKGIFFQKHMALNNLRFGICFRLDTAAVYFTAERVYFISRLKLPFYKLPPLGAERLFN